MFKLTVVHGQAQGKSYMLQEGKVSLGRAQDNEIILESQKVSKKHCVLVVSNQEVLVQDTGSSNGTFINGVLTKIKKIIPGDKLSVGEFVLVLSKVEPPKPKETLPSNVLMMPGVTPVGGGIGNSTTNTLGEGIQELNPKPNIAPTDLKGKIQFYFESYVLNFLYNLNEKQEWRSLFVIIFSGMIFLSTVIGVQPVIDRVQGKLGREARERALLIARQMVELNSKYIFEKQETKIDISFAEKEKSVKAAYLVDMEGRVLAPSRKLNQYLTDANEASFSATAREKFIKMEKAEESSKIFDGMIAVAIPLRIFSQTSGKNVTVATSIVFYDRDQVLLDPGSEALAYVQALILAAIIGVIAYFSLYRITLKPLQTLNMEVDQALKQNRPSVEIKYKMEEIGPLIDVINAALQRSAQSSGFSGLQPQDLQLNEGTQAALRFMGERITEQGVMIFSGDRKIIWMNSTMEEITGIRSNQAIGFEIASVARDEAFKAFMEDSLNRTQSSLEPITDNFEFSGVDYKTECIGIMEKEAYKGFIFHIKKSG